MKKLSFIEFVEELLEYGELKSNQFGKYLTVTVDTETQPVLEQNFLKEVLAGDWKQTAGVPKDNLSTMSKYEILLDNDDRFSTLILSFPGPEHDKLLGKDSLTAKTGREYPHRDIQITGYIKK